MSISLPKEIWDKICDKLPLKDLLNMYKSFPFLINKKIYDYLPLNNKKFWKKGITHIIKICGTCRMYHLNYMANCLNFPEDDTCFDNEKLTDKEYKILKKYTLIFQARSTLEICYKNKIKIPFNKKIKCSYHKNDFAYKIRDEIISLTENKWYELLDSDESKNICSICGEIGHNKYDKDCLLNSKQLRLKEILELNQISKSKFIKNYFS